MGNCERCDYCLGISFSTEWWPEFHAAGQHAQLRLHSDCNG